MTKEDQERAESAAVQLRCLPARDRTVQLSEMSALDRALTLACFTPVERDKFIHQMSPEGQAQSLQDMVVSVEEKPGSSHLPDDGGPVSLKWDARARAPRLSDLNQSYAPKPVPPTARPAAFDKESTWPEWAKNQTHYPDATLTQGACVCVRERCVVVLAWCAHSEGGCVLLADHAEHAFNGIMFDVQCREVPTPQPHMLIPSLPVFTPRPSDRLVSP